MTYIGEQERTETWAIDGPGDGSSLAALRSGKEKQNSGSVKGLPCVEMECTPSQMVWKRMVAWGGGEGKRCKKGKPRAVGKSRIGQLKR